jgi:genome maintenance exonuclease 1
LIVDKYTYPDLKRIEKNGIRRYTSDGTEKTAVPSVTTILSETGDKTALLEWRKRVGDAEANRISTESAGLGTRVHNALEKYALGEEWDKFGSNHGSQLAKAMTHSMINQGFEKVDELWGVEVGLIAQGVYAGTADAVGIHEGKQSIIDFKTARKLKKREWIEDYFLQGVFYAEAHNEMFGTNIERIAILMVDRDARFAEYIVENDEYHFYKDKAMARLAEYYGL